MNLSQISVDRPVTVLVIATAVIAVAMVMVPQIAVEMFPSIEPPFAMVVTSYPGANPLEVEQNVTERLEKQLSNLSGLESMTSTSSSGSSRIQLEFGFDVDLSEAKDDIRDSLEVVQNALPDDAGSPQIRTFDSFSDSIVELVMVGDESPDTLKRLGEEVVQPLLERVDGVASADVMGGETRVVRVDLRGNRLEAYGITANQVTAALKNENVQMSSGDITVHNRVYDISVDEEYTSLEEIKRAVVANVRVPGEGSVNRSHVVRLEDIADVYEGVADTANTVYVNGEPAIMLDVLNESDTNSVQVATAATDALEAINAELPEGVSVTVLYDNTTYIGSVLSTVYTSAYQGIILAMVVLFLFLRNWRTTLIIGISIPISLLVTLMCMYFFDITLNMISLTGLVLGLGMIVDNSIVILENIYKYRERGAKLRPAAILGSKEMLTAIVASTLTTLSVFIPMIIWKDDLGMIGEVFSDLVFTVVIALSVSLLVAVTIVPALSAGVIKIFTPTQRTPQIRFLHALSGAGEAVLVALERAYRGALRFALSNRLLVLTLVVVVLGMSVAVFSTMGINFAPGGESDDAVTVRLTMPVGTSLARTEEVIFAMAELVEENVDGYEKLTASTGGRGGGTNTGSIRIVLPQPEEQIQSPAEIQTELRKFINLFPDAEFTFSAGRGFGAGAAIDVIVQSDNLDLASETAAEIKELIKANVPGAEDPVTDLDDGVPEYRVVIDKDRAAAYGLTVSGIALAIDTLVDGSTPTTYWEGGTELDVIVQLAEEERETLPDLDALFLVSSTGERVALSNVATYTEAVGPKDITREDETRTVHVTADLATGATATEVMAQIEALLAAEYVAPEGVEVDFGGDSDEIQELIGPLLTVVAVAILMIFAVMASQFESLVDPFIIFFSIPLLFIGVVGIYQITGEAFSLFSVIGMVVLAGIVVNNGIVLVDYTNLLRKRGSKLYDAVLEAAPSRLRPVLMTSLTTILGMVPLGFFPGEGTEMIRPIGQTIVGGLVGSTFITLFVTPVVYTLVNSDRKRGGVWQRLIRRRSAPGTAAAATENEIREVAG